MEFIYTAQIKQKQHLLNNNNTLQKWNCSEGRNK